MLPSIKRNANLELLFHQFVKTLIKSPMRFLKFLHDAFEFCDLTPVAFLSLEELLPVHIRLVFVTLLL